MFPFFSVLGREVKVEQRLMTLQHRMFLEIRLLGSQPLIITVMAGQAEESLMEQNRTFGGVSSM